MHKFVDLTGEKFGKLMAVAYSHQRKDGSAIWKFRCDCGNDYIGVGWKARNGQKIDCGCVARENIKNAATKHGLVNIPIYKRWAIMKRRCIDGEKGKYYKDKGIKVCDRWSESFSNFYEDMNKGFSPELTLDRIDFNKGYEPSNCRWATTRQQSINKSTTIFVKVKGTKQPISSYCKENGLNRNQMVYRIRKGLTLEESEKQVRELQNSKHLN